MDTISLRLAGREKRRHYSFPGVWHPHPGREALLSAMYGSQTRARRPRRVACELGADNPAVRAMIRVPEPPRHPTRRRARHQWPSRRRGARRCGRRRTASQHHPRRLRRDRTLPEPRFAVGFTSTLAGAPFGGRNGQDNQERVHDAARRSVQQRHLPVPQSGSRPSSRRGGCTRNRAAPPAPQPTPPPVWRDRLERRLLIGQQVCAPRLHECHMA